MQTQYSTLEDPTAKQSCWRRNAVTIIALLFLTSLGLLIGVIVLASKSSSSSNQNYSTISANLSGQIYGMRDTSVKPCDDFYQYACGGWFKANPYLLNNTDNYYFSFTNIGNLVYKQQLDVLAGHFPFLTSFYDQCIDVKSIDNGQNDASVLFNEVNGEGELGGLIGLVGKYQATGLGLSSFFNLQVNPDNLYADTYRAYLSPTGLTAPISFYNDTLTPGFSQYFIEQVTKTFIAGNDDDPLQHANDVWYLESLLASNLSVLPNIMDQGVLIENTIRLSISDLNARTGLVFDSYFAALSSTPAITVIDVVTLPYFIQLGNTLNYLYRNGKTNVIRSYIKWHAIFGVMNYLPAAFRNIAANFTDNGLPAYRFRSASSPLYRSEYDTYEGDNAKFGVPSKHVELLKNTDSARESYCVQSTIAAFSDLFSHEWVQKDFSDTQRQQATILVDAIYSQIGARIREVEWLDPPTTAAALDKWSKIVKNVGYSEDWLDYSSLTFTADNSFFSNYRAISRFMTVSNNGLYDQTVDRTLMPTRDYMIQNAFYNPSTNNINLLGGLIFPPYFDVTSPMMLNFAAYGMVIGHEITHGFDNSGRLFNGTGAYINWWTNSSATEFNKRAQCLIDQYSSFITADHHVDGAQTLGENIADNGGINTAYAAYRNYAQPPNGIQILPDITNDQLFFLYYAQNWCAETTTAFALNRLKTDVHSPPKWRVNGPLSNNPDFAKAYSCSSDSFMGRSLTNNRCWIW